MFHINLKFIFFKLLFIKINLLNFAPIINNKFRKRLFELVKGKIINYKDFKLLEKSFSLITIY